MPVVQVLRTRDRRWRVEVRDDTRMDLFLRGHLLLRGATLDQIGEQMASDGVTVDDLVKD